MTMFEPLWKRARRAVVAGAVAVSAIAGADEVDLPNVFQSGDTARASEVNANFGALEAAIDDNARKIQSNTTSIRSSILGLQSSTASIAANTDAIGDLQSRLEGARTGIGVLVDGSEVGRFVGFVPRTRVLDLGAVLGVSPPQPEAAVITYVAEEGAAAASAVEVISDSGYLFQLSTSSAASTAFPEGALLWRTIWYDQPACQGVPYWNLGTSELLVPGNRGGLVQRQGVVFASPDSQATASSTYYVPRGAEAETATLPSRLMISLDTAEPVCETLLSNRPFLLPSSAVKLLPNDPDVTGVSAYAGGVLELH